MPASDRLTRSTWWAWSWIDRLRCSTPMPPSRAMAIAIRASVTVSIALDSSGMDNSTLRVSRVIVLTRLEEHIVEGEAERNGTGGLDIHGSSPGQKVKVSSYPLSRARPAGGHRV